VTELNLINEYASAAPIAAWLGFSASGEGGEIEFRLAMAEHHIGNQLIRALHGGAIASFLEFSSQAALHARLLGERSVATVNADVDYLASARGSASSASAAASLLSKLPAGNAMSRRRSRSPASGSVSARGKNNFHTAYRLLWRGGGDFLYASVNSLRVISCCGSPLSPVSCF